MSDNEYYNDNKFDFPNYFEYDVEEEEEDYDDDDDYE